MKKEMNVSGVFTILGLAAFMIQSCSKTTPGPIPNPNSGNFISSAISSDSSKYSTRYYYDANNRLTGRRTDSVDDTLEYNGSNQIISKISIHYNASQLMQKDTFNFVYDNQGRIAEVTTHLRKNGVEYTRNKYVYDANNNIVIDSNFAPLANNSAVESLSSISLRTYTGGNVTGITNVYSPGHLKYYAGSTPDSITQINYAFTFDANPSVFKAFDKNTRVVLGNLNFNTNNVLIRTQSAIGKTSNTLFTYVYSNVFTYDPTTLYPISVLVSSTGGALVGPYHLNFTYHTN